MNKREEIRNFFYYPIPKTKGNLEEALYSISEMGLWPDEIDSLSKEQALFVWCVVEKMIRQEFPNELKM